MTSFDDFKNDVIEGVKALAVGQLKSFVTQLQSDTTSFLQKSATKLKTWTELLAEGRLDEEEFALLVKSQAALAQMHALTQAGIGASRLKHLRDDLISLVVNTAIRRFLP